eukprot:gnl/Carplike_NY0171/655_a903_3108.p1 GENE.gnl/Carplike_NY0171/655_a903_3108~~gnl/Carplike_NY0171/655_a903_3108.p1  ORF type:complete len:110 (-),score=14.34 gnl/Carplike_NY0171/655_a903_3108:34-363(-)
MDNSTAKKRTTPQPKKTTKVIRPKRRNVPYKSENYEEIDDTRAAMLLIISIVIGLAGLFLKKRILLYIACFFSIARGATWIFKEIDGGMMMQIASYMPFIFLAIDVFKK